MKELILFSFITVFIACQKLPQTSSKTTSLNSAPTVSSSQSTADAGTEILMCDRETTGKLDLAQELLAAQNPGIHYRPPVLTSVAALDEQESNLVCLSQVSTSEPETPKNQPVPPANSWEYLTQKWDWTAEPLASKPLQQTAISPVCTETFWLTHEGNPSFRDFALSVASH